MSQMVASLVQQGRRWIFRQGVLATALGLILAFSGQIAAAAAVDFPPIEQQEASRWCWASAVQNVLAQFGIVQTQVDIVKRASGGPVVNESATPAFVARLLRSYGLDASDLHRTLSRQQLAEVFGHGSKIIADTMPTMSEHAIVLQGFEDDGTMVISDPYNGVSEDIPLMDLLTTWRWIDTIVVGDVPAP